MTHTKFLSKLLPVLKENHIHVAVETCMDVPWEPIQDLIPPLIDEFLVDLKHVDGNKLELHTKGDVGGRISENIRKLDKLGGNIIIRIPLIPKFNDTDKEIQGMLDFIESLSNVSEVHFLPYHTYGTKKYELLGRRYKGEMTSTDEDKIHRFKQLALDRGLIVKIGG